MRRRNFLRVVAAGSGMILFGCGGVLAPDEDLSDIILIGNSERNAAELESFYKKDPSKELAAGKKVIIETVDNGEKTPATISLAGGHPLITYGSGKRTQSATLKFSGLSLVLVDGNGNVLEGKNGKASAGFFSKEDLLPLLRWGIRNRIITPGDLLEIRRLKKKYDAFFKEDFKNALAPASPEAIAAREEILDKIFSLGVKITAFALAIWLGSSIASAILSGIAFIAFYALLIGALAIIIGKSETILDWISKVTGVEITIQDITNFFSKGAEYIGNLLAEITGLISRNSLAQ